MFEVSGNNGAGKTSILDSIWWALAGTRTHQTDPIQHGHDKGRIKLDLGAITVEREFKRLPSAPGRQDERITTRLIVKNAAGAIMQSPQSILDQLLGSLSFDPLAFASKGAAEQYQALQQACGVDLQSIDLAERCGLPGTDNSQSHGQGKACRARPVQCADGDRQSAST